MTLPNSMSHCPILKSRDAVVLLARSWPELASFLYSQILRIMTYLTTYNNSLVSKLEAVNEAKSPVSLFLMSKTFEQRRSFRRSLASQPRFPPRTGKIRLACEASNVQAHVICFPSRTVRWISMVETSVSNISMGSSCRS